MSLAIPTAFRIFRPQTSPLTLGGGAETLGAGLIAQEWVDFDALGPHFRVVIGGAVQNVFGGSGNLRLRVGGTYSAVDGDLVIDTTATAGGFAVFSISQVVANIWSGIQLVKLSGFNWNASFNFICLDLVPA
jgi:hypothetical protein